MRRFAPLVLAPLAFALPACGADGPSAGADADPPRVPAAFSQPERGGLYEGNGIVCDDGSGPKLWLGGARLSLGPQSCGGIALVDWDRRRVGGESTARGTTSGSYHVVGVYDGESLAVTEVGPYEDDPSAFGTEPDTTSPCDEPTGGWHVPDPAHMTQNDVGAAVAYAKAQPDYVGSWNTHLEPALHEFGPVVVNVVFTGGAARHERELREVWDGPLCVVARDVPTARELSRVRKEVEAGLGTLGLEMLWSAGPAVEPVVEIGIVADAGGRAQAVLDARYGRGVVRLIPALTPVS